MTKIISYPKRRNSQSVTSVMAAEIKALIKTGMCQHDIAAHYGINQGRVSEINTGMKFPDIEPSQGDLFG